MNKGIIIGNGSVVHGDVVVAHTIESSFNRISNSNSAELQEKLMVLTKGVAELTSQLPQREARQVAQDLDSFVKEALSEQPRKRWYEVTAEGLMEAAKAVGELGIPVISAVKEVLSLLA